MDTGNNVLVGYDSNKILSEFNASRKFNSSGDICGNSNTSVLIIEALIGAS